MTVFIRIRNHSYRSTRYRSTALMTALRTLNLISRTTVPYSAASRESTGGGAERGSHMLAELCEPHLTAR